MSRAALVVLLLAVFASAGCGDRNSQNQPTAGPYVEPELIRSEPLTPFPRAATVRLFVQKDLKDADADGYIPFINDKGRLLSSAERREVESLLSIATYDEAPAIAACFVPHHFFRYYNARGKQIGEVAICFCCGGMSIRPSWRILKANQLLSFEYQRLEALIQRMGLPTQLNCD